MTLHHAPTDHADHRRFHFHIEFHPPLRKPNLLKYLAGPEIGGGNFLSDTLPEAKAEDLRAFKRALHDRPEAALADVRALLDRLRELHRNIRDAVVTACEEQQVEALSRVDRQAADDTIYAVDVISENILLRFLRNVARAFVCSGSGRA